MALEQFQTEENIPAEVPAEIPAQKPQATKEALYAEEQAIKLHKKRAEYDQHIQRLVDKFSNRQTSYNPQLLALGEGLLTPGKTGSFFEGLGLGMKGYREAGEKMQEQDIQNAKLENELRTGQIKQLTDDYLLQQEIAGDKYLQDMAAKRLKPLQTQLAVSDVSGKPTVQELMSGTGYMGYGSGPGGMITISDIDKAPRSAKKQMIEDYKRQQEDIKINQKRYETTKFGAPYKGTVEGAQWQAEAVAKIISTPYYQSAPPEEQKRIMAQTYDLIGLNEEPSGVTDGTGAPKIETTSQKEIRLKGEEKTTEKRSEENVKREQNFFNASDTAQQRRISADNVERIAKSRPKFFNTLQKPNVMDAVGRLISSGVQTPWGSINIDMKDASAAAGNLLDDVGVTSLLGLDKTDIKQADREAYALFLRDLAIMQVAQRRSSNAVGQGSISDYEQRLFASTTFMKDDDSRVQQLKAKMVRMQAQMDEDLAKLIVNWQEKNPNKPITKFLYASDEFQNFKKSYEDKLEKLRNQNADLFGSVTSVDTSSREVAPTSTGNYADIIQQEKERRKLR